MQENELDFWNRYQELRRQKMPVKSSLYSYLDKIYRVQRRDFETKWKSVYDRKLPPTSIRYYNELFSVAHHAVKNLFKKYPVQKRTHALAEQAYGVKLKVGDTFSDLLKLDVFGQKTNNQDIHPEIVFGDMRDAFRREPVLISNTHHFFFHRPQKSEHIFFHEIVVGFLLNEIENGGHVHTPKTLPLMDPGYSSLAAYVLTRLAKLMKKTPGQLVALHFEDSETVTRSLPLFVKDLMLSVSHIYWYLDLYSKRSGRHSPAMLLALTYNFFIVPCLERQRVEKGLHLIPKAGGFIDQLLLKNLVELPKSEMAQITDIHIVRQLMICVEQLWRPQSH